MANADTDRSTSAARVPATMRSFLIAAAAFLVVMAGTTLPTPLYPIYQQAADFSSFILTVIFAVYAGGVIAALLLVGPWSDQIGRKPMLLAGLALALLSDVLFMRGASLWTILSGRVLSGLSAGIFAATATVAVIELAPPHLRSKASLFATGANVVGLGCGPVLSGTLATFFANPLFVPFLVHAVLLAILAVLFFAVVPETAHIGGKAKLSVRKLAVSREAKPVFVPAAIAAFASFMLAGFVTSVGSGYLSQDLGVTSHAVVGLVAGLLFLASAFGQMGDQMLAKEKRLTIGAATLLTGLLVLLVAFAVNSLWLLISGIAVGGLGFGIAFHSGLAAVTEASPQDRRAEAVATYFTVSYLAISLPVLGVGAAQVYAGLRPTAIGFDVIAIIAVLVAIAQIVRLNRRDSTEAAR